MTNNPYAPLPSDVEAAESSLPLYSKVSYPDASLSSNVATPSPAVYPPSGLSQISSGRRFGAFTILWPAGHDWRHTLVCEWGLNKEQTAENLRLAMPDVLGQKSAEQMIFQIPAGKNWANVSDSNWNDVLLGTTYEEVRVEIVLTRRETYKPVMIIFLVSSFILSIPFILAVIVSNSQ